MLMQWIAVRCLDHMSLFCVCVCALRMLGNLMLMQWIAVRCLGHMSLFCVCVCVCVCVEDAR